jgi:pimeloyl-ACP methyl ester carboxylesterase
VTDLNAIKRWSECHACDVEYLLETRRRQMQLRGAPYDERDRHIRLEELCNHRLLIERQTAEQVLKATPGCREAIDYPAPVSYMQQWAAIDPAEEWKEVTPPVMVVYGSSDYIATSADAPYLTAMLNSFHPGQAALRAIAGMDHSMTKVASMEESMKRPAGAPVELNTEVLDAISAWLRATMNGPA